MLGASLKQRLKNRELTVGPIMTHDFWPGYLETFKQRGMHFAVLDLEHGAVAWPQVAEVCRVARLIEFPLIIRPETGIYHVIRKCIDMGPSGLLMPWTETEEQMNALRDGSFTPPKGRRGPGGPAVAHNRTLDKAGWDEVEENLVMIPQIESPLGIERLPGLVNHDWVDATMLGPYDLALNLGLCWQPTHPELVNAIETVHKRSAEVGKPCGTVVYGRDLTKFWIDRGFHFFIYGDPVAMVSTECGRVMDEVRELYENRPK